MKIEKFMEEISEKLDTCVKCSSKLTDEEKEFSKKTDEPMCSGCFRRNWAVL